MALSLLFAAYFIATPFITVYQMKAAAEIHDAEALSEYIEFPSVRQGFKDQMNASFVKRMGADDMKDNPFAVLGTAFAGAMIDKMVDAYITPAGIAHMMAGEKPDSSEEKVSIGSGLRKPLADISMSYESLDKFIVTVKGVSGEDSKLVLRRIGIGWKLTEIILPIDK